MNPWWLLLLVNRRRASELGGFFYLSAELRMTLKEWQERKNMRRMRQR